MILFSDPHLSEESADTVFQEVLPGIEAISKETGDNELACLGDFWHVRYKVPVVLQNRVYEWLISLRAKGLRLRFLPGNHDQVDEAGENALQVFAGMENVRVYTEPTHDENGLWIPYRRDPEAIRGALAQYPDPTVLFMHHGVRGALMNDRHPDTEGLPLGMFQRFRMVWCGHYHKRQNVGRGLFYVGSTHQTKADEGGQDKGVTLWNGKTFQHINRTWGKRYHNIELDHYTGGVIPVGNVDLRDEVRVTTKAGVDPEKVGRALAAMGLVNHVVIPEVEQAVARLQVGANASLIEFARAYVTEKGGPDTDTLWRTFQEIAGVTP